jgi:hypothetical protein
VEDWLQAEAELKAEGADDDEHRSTEAGGEDSAPATAQERRATRKRNGNSRRVTRQPHTH